MEEVQNNVPQQDPPVSYVQGVHQNLIQAFGKDNVPDINVFTDKINRDPSYMQGVHQNLIQAFGKGNVPDITQFSDRLKKKSWWRRIFPYTISIRITRR